MESNNQYSDVEILTDAINTLGDLMIPVALADQLTMEISRVRKNLIVLCDEIKNAKSEAETPVLSVVPDEEAQSEEVSVEEIDGASE